MCAACDMLRPLLAEGLVSSVVCDTYARELERYGEHTMEAVERYFHLDSRSVLELLHLLSAEPPADPEQLRWRMALRLVDGRYVRIISSGTCRQEGFARQNGRVVPERVQPHARRIYGTAERHVPYASQARSRDARHDGMDIRKYAAGFRTAQSRTGGANRRYPGAQQAVGTTAGGGASVLEPHTHDDEPLVPFPEPAARTGHLQLHKQALRLHVCTNDIQ